MQNIQLFGKMKQKVITCFDKVEEDKDMMNADKLYEFRLKQAERRKQRQVKEQTDKDNLLDLFIQTEKNASKAQNLSRLINKTWSEEHNAYKLMSQVTKEREARIKQII